MVIHSTDSGKTTDKIKSPETKLVYDTEIISIVKIIDYLIIGIWTCLTAWKKIT